MKIQQLPDGTGESLGLLSVDVSFWMPEKYTLLACYYHAKQSKFQGSLFISGVKNLWFEHLATFNNFEAQYDDDNLYISIDVKGIAWDITPLC